MKEEVAPVEDTVTEKPKKKLREAFEPSLDEAEPKEDRPTWDITSDLATREIDIRRVISKHETISKEAAEEVSKETTETERKDSKSLSGILKKSSVFSVTDSSSTSNNGTGESSN